VIALMKKAIQISETLINSYQSTGRHNPEDSHLRSHCRENLKSLVIWKELLVKLEITNTEIIMNGNPQFLPFNGTGRISQL
jgi:hypothetical protein